MRLRIFLIGVMAFLLLASYQNQAMANPAKVCQKQADEQYKVEKKVCDEEFNKAKKDFTKIASAKKKQVLCQKTALENKPKNIQTCLKEMANQAKQGGKSAVEGAGKGAQKGFKNKGKDLMQ